MCNVMIINEWIFLLAQRLVIVMDGSSRYLARFLAGRRTAVLQGKESAATEHLIFPGSISLARWGDGMGRLVLGAAGNRSCSEGTRVVVDIMLIRVHGLNAGCLIAVLILLLL